MAFDNVVTTVPNDLCWLPMVDENVHETFFSFFRTAITVDVIDERLTSLIAAVIECAELRAAGIFDIGLVSSIERIYSSLGLRVWSQVLSPLSPLSPSSLRLLYPSSCYPATPPSRPVHPVPPTPSLSAYSWRRRLQFPHLL